MHLCPKHSVLERINPVCIFLLCLLASSVALHEGSPHPITNGTVGEITRTGVYTAVFSNMISLSLPALISVLRDRTHVKVNMLRRTLFKADIGPRMTILDAEQVEVERRLTAALLACVIDTSEGEQTTKDAKNVVIRTVDGHLKEWKQKINAEGDDSEPTSWQGWVLMLMGVAFYGLIMVPENVKIGQIWYWTSHLSVMLLTLGLTISFWRKRLVMARVKYALYCSSPWMIFFLLWCSMLLS